MFIYIKIDLVNILNDQKKISPNSLLIGILNDLLSDHTETQKQAFELLTTLHESKDDPRLLISHNESKDNSHALISHILGLCFFEAIGTQRHYESAFRLFSEASELQYKHSDYWLGTCYSQGLGVAEDKSRGHALRENAAKHGHVTGLFYLGECYRTGNTVEKDLKKAFEFTLGAAEQGMCVAESNTGLNYRYGQGVEKDPRKAFEFFNRAARQGSSAAACELGIFYYYGEDSIGLMPDLKKAFEFFRIAKDGHSNLAKYYLGMCYLTGKGTEKYERRAVELFSEAGLNGKNKDALYQLALCYLNGIGTVKDTEFAIKLFTELSEEDYTDAVLQLAKLQDSKISLSKKVILKARDLFLQDFFGLQLEDIHYQLSFLRKDGELFENDFATTLQWVSRKEDMRSEIQYELQLAQKESKHALASYNVIFMKRRFLSSTSSSNSDQNNDKKHDIEKTFISKMEIIKNIFDKADQNLSTCCSCLYGKEEDLKKAFELIVAAKQGFAEGHYLIGLYLELSDDIQKNKEGAFQEFMLAANLEHEPSIYKVAWCYENGIGVTKNMDKAKNYYSLVTTRGDCADKKTEKEIDSIANSADSKKSSP